jgi:hypothetical protein
MADQSYLDRLYDEIGQYGDRIKATFGGRGGLPQIVSNWTTPYETPERRQEAMRLAAQQAKEEYMAQQNAGQLSLKDALESQQIREDIGKRLQTLGPDAAYIAEQERLRMQAAKEGYMAQQDAAQVLAQGYQQPAISGLDSYDQYINQNETLLMGPQGQYAAPTREEYQKYFVEGQAPPKVIPVTPAVAEMAAAMPAQPQTAQAAMSSAMPGVDLQAAPQQAGQQRPMTVRQQIAALPYEADRLEATRKLINEARTNEFNKGLKYIESIYDAGSSQAENARKALEKSIDVNLPLPKPIEESAQYKGAEKNWEGGLRESRRRISFNIAQAQRAQELMEIDPNLALIHMRQNLIKPLNSILSNDAIQLSEMIIRYPDLLSGAELSQLGGKKLLNPTTIANKFLSLDENVQKNIVEKFTSALIDANPQRFLETAINGINGYVKSFNSDLTDQVVAPTSPNIAKQLGATFLQPLESRQPKSEVQVVRPGQQASAPMPAKQKPAIPLDIEAIRARYKRQ